MPTGNHLLLLANNIRVCKKISLVYKLLQEQYDSPYTEFNCFEGVRQLMPTMPAVKVNK